MSAAECGPRHCQAPAAAVSSSWDTLGGQTGPSNAGNDGSIDCCMEDRQLMTMTKKRSATAAGVNTGAGAGCLHTPQYTVTGRWVRTITLIVTALISAAIGNT